MTTFTKFLTTSAASVALLSGAAAGPSPAAAKPIKCDPLVQVCAHTSSVRSFTAKRKCRVRSRAQRFNCRRHLSVTTAQRAR